MGIFAKLKRKKNQDEDITLLHQSAPVQKKGILISKFDNTDIEKHIHDFEKKYNLQFPEQHRNFLIKYNGGDTPKTEFKINKVSSDLRGFYGLGKADEFLNYSFFDEWDIIDYVKDGVIPIGSTDFGDKILMGIKTENAGVIFFWYHGRPKKYIKLTEDFKAFIKKCKSEEIGHIPTIEERKAIAKANGFKREIPYFIADWQKEIDEYKNMVQEELIIDAETSKTQAGKSPKEVAREENKKIDELDKAMMKIVRSIAKPYGFKIKGNCVWVVQNGFFFNMILFLGRSKNDELQVSADVYAKPMYADDLLWDILDMSSNKNERLSLRADGAFALFGLPVASESIKVESLEVSDFETPLKNALDVLQRLLQQVKGSEEEWFYVEEEKCSSYFQDDALRLMILLHFEKYAEAMAYIESSDGSGGFVVGDESLYDRVIKYCKSKTHLGGRQKCNK